MQFMPQANTKGQYMGIKEHQARLLPPLFQTSPSPKLLALDSTTSVFQFYNSSPGTQRRE